MRVRCNNLSDVVTFALAEQAHLEGIVSLLIDDELGQTRETLDLARYQTAFEEIDADSNQYLIVGLDAGLVVSTLQLTVIPNLSRVGMKRGQIEAVRVAEDRREQGIGSSMLRWAIELARSKGCSMVQLTTDRRRAEVIGFYERLGFVDSHHGLKLMLQG